MVFVRCIGVARIFGWGGGLNFLQKFLKEELFVEQRYRRMEDQKPLPGLALYQVFAEGRGLKLNENVCIWRVESKLV